MSLSANYTNAITNFLHAIFLFIYFIGALIHYLRKDNTFSICFVVFFLNLFVIKLLGVYVHYFKLDTSVTMPNAWLAISLLVIMVNFLLVEALNIADVAKIIVVFLSIASTFLFMTLPANFIYIAFPVIIVYAIAAYYTKDLLRIAFLMVIASNIIWIVSRQVLTYKFGHQVPTQYMYDNDVYHILLIISTFTIYKAIADKRGLPPSAHTS